MSYLRQTPSTLSRSKNNHLCSDLPLKPHIDEDAGILVVIVKRHFDNAKQTTKKDALAGS
jgi:hypothetical protein